MNSDVIRVKRGSNFAEQIFHDKVLRCIKMENMIRDIKGRFAGKPLTTSEIKRCSLGCTCPDDMAIDCIRHGEKYCSDGVISEDFAEQ